LAGFYIPGLDAPSRLKGRDLGEKMLVSRVVI